MKLSDRQSILLDFMRRNGGKRTLTEATAQIGFGIYYRPKFYVGQTIKRMMDRGLVHRVSRGLYAIGSGEKKGELI